MVGNSPLIRAYFLVGGGALDSYISHDIAHTDI